MSLVSGLVTDATNFVGGVAKNVTTNVGSAVNAITNPSELVSAVRKMTLPLGGNVFTAAVVEFLGPENSDDWRVRLSIPFNFFMGSAVFGPLIDAGGLVFPYTPTINISASANYDSIDVTHQNYQFAAYKNSNPGDITIDAPFNVEDAEQAKYWLAAVHFLRSATKMYTGDSSEAGSPPPILSLSGYGDYVFKRVPVVVTNFSISLPNDCDYISAKSDRGFGIVSDITSGNLNANSIGKVAGPLLMSSMNASNLLGGAIGGFFGGDSHVPTKSNINITLKPVYSREATKNFSLQSFVNGTYIRGGYI